MATHPSFLASISLLDDLIDSSRGGDSIILPAFKLN